MHGARLTKPMGYASLFGSCISPSFHIIWLSKLVDGVESEFGENRFVEALMPVGALEQGTT